MYEIGRGVPQNYVLAHMWFSLSAAQGNQNGAQKRDIVAQHMTSAQRADQLAREWKAIKRSP
jgi:uncharacterized protein